MIILISLQMQVRGYLVAAISDSEVCQGSGIIQNQRNNEECKNHKQEYIRWMLRHIDKILYTFEIKFMEILNRYLETYPLIGFGDFKKSSVSIKSFL